MPQLSQSKLCRSLTVISNLVDPASGHMLASRAKPCMSKFKQILLDCGWLIISAIINLMVQYYLDNRGNSRANTCCKFLRFIYSVERL